MAKKKAKQQDEYTKRAIKLIKNGSSLFITGKAGTGKTTLLRHIYDSFYHEKKIAIVAPTGVAAKQAGGVTIHSLLHLPLSPYLPSAKKRYNLYRLSDDDIVVIQQIDLLIIDEVSMVRCDMLDEMDDVFRHYRKKQDRNKPFGGIQVVMFGDLHQLMPVAPDEEWEILKSHYKSPYFFSSDVYTRLKCPMLELKHIYRQTDVDFINLLNHVRDGELTPEDKNMLETRFIKDFIPNDDEGYIRVTTHNWMAKKYNQFQLDNLDKPLYEYPAGIEGKIQWTEYPTEACLKLKVGARVMFIRNDNTWHYYVNGTLGTVVKLGEWYIEVQIDNGHTIEVPRVRWDFERYKYNKFRQVLEIEHYGEFRQYPLKLAWCVTIHKSQGLTFDKVVIDAGRAFTYGQVYVALSRCRRFEGIVCVSKIKDKALGADPVVEDFLEQTRKIKVVEPEQQDTGQQPLEESTQSSTAQKKQTLQLKLESVDGVSKKQKQRIPEPEPTRGKRWTTKEQEKLDNLFNNGASFIEIARWVGRPVEEVTTRLKKLGLIMWKDTIGKYVKIKK